MGHHAIQVYFMEKSHHVAIGFITHSSELPKDMLYTRILLKWILLVFYELTHVAAQ